MREQPVFIPHGDGQLAAVVAFPPAEPKGLAMLLTGIGLPQVIGSNLWSRVARRLAEQGVASVRFDYEGIGESTGLVPRFSLAETESVVAQASSVLEATRRAFGADRFAVAGSCIGSRVTLELARRPDCVAAVCLAAPLMNPGGWTKLRRRSQRWPFVSYVRSHPLLRKILVGPMKRALAEKRPAGRLLENVRSAAAHARILFLYSTSPRDYYGDHLERLFGETARSLGEDQRRRFEFRILSEGPLTAFDALSPEIQDVIVESVVEWLVPAFSELPSGDRRLSAVSA